MTFAQAIIVGAITSTALSQLIIFFVQRHDSKKMTPEKEALLALCSERLESLLRKWIHADAVDRTASRWATINYLYKAYKALNGNGDIEALYDVAADLKATTG